MTEQRLAEIEQTWMTVSYRASLNGELIAEIRRLRKLGLDLLKERYVISRMHGKDADQVESEYSRRRAEWLGEEKIDG